MSGIYASLKPRLLSLLVGSGMPGSADLYVVGVDDSYVYDADHATIDDIPVESIVFPPAELLGFTLNGTTLDAPNIEIGGATVGKQLHGVVVFFSWSNENETALVAFLDQTTNTSLPQEIVTGQLEIRWNDLGICRI